MLHFRNQYIKLSQKMGAVLYEPLTVHKNQRIAILIMHSDSDYEAFPLAGGMADRGFSVLCTKVSGSEDSFEEKLLAVSTAVTYLKKLEGIEKIILMGHSGGATLFSAYKAIAENGPSIFQKDRFLYPCFLKEKLPDVDGIMFIDSNWGNGAMTLISVDPAVVSDDFGVNLALKYDIYAAENGYRDNQTHYEEKFLKEYFKAQRERNNKLISKALDRLALLNQGKGRYVDDEPFIIAGAEQGFPCNKLIPQDISLLSHTKGSYLLLSAHKEAKIEKIFSVRKPENFGNTTAFYREGTLITSVRNFLSQRALLAEENYRITEDGFEGIAWNRSYNCPPENVKYIHSPILCMGMTGSYEYLAAEEIYQNAVSEDKTIAFVEGAGHMLKEIDETYGDTQAVLYEYIEKWLTAKGRFFDE